MMQKLKKYNEIIILCDQHILSPWHIHVCGIYVVTILKNYTYNLH